MNIKTTLFIFLISIAFEQQAQEKDRTSTNFSDCSKTEYQTEELTPFDFNTKCKTEAYPFITSDGQDLYYTNNQTQDWIFYTHKDAGKWRVPVPVVIDNFSSSIRSCYLTADKMTLYFISGTTLFSCQSLNGSLSRFHQLQKIEIINNTDLTGIDPFSYLSFTSDMRIMYAYIGNSRDVSMACYTLVAENRYAFKEVVTTTNKEMGCISKNGLVYYFTNNESTNELFCKKRNAITEDFGPTVYVVKTFEEHLDVSQVSFAEDGKLMAVVVSNKTWDKNDLYFLDMDLTDSNMVVHVPRKQPAGNVIATTPATVTPVLENSVTPEEIVSRTPVVTKEINNRSGASISKIEIGMAYPNPAKQVFYFYYSVQGDKSDKQAHVVMMDIFGKEVYSSTLENLKGEAKIETGDIAAGTYFIRIDYNGTSSALCKIVIMNN